METKIYVDVLLAINYVINSLLVLCTAKLTGRRPRRRRIVAAALFGSACSLAIFLPFFGFMVSLLARLVIACGIVLLAFPFQGGRVFFKQLFVFYSVSFFFAGIMLAVWILLTPTGMHYYNGVVYFDISSVSLLVTTAAAYGLLTLFHRFSRESRIKTAVYDVTIHYRGRTAGVRGLVDTGNSLREPFSDLPVIVCGLDAVAGLLPAKAAADIRNRRHLEADFLQYGVQLRLIPYGGVGKRGVLAAFPADRLELMSENGRFVAEQAYVAVSPDRIGGGAYNAVLNPDLVAVRSYL